MDPLSPLSSTSARPLSLPKNRANGVTSRLTSHQISTLSDHFDQGEIPTAKQVQAYIEEHFQVRFTERQVNEYREALGIARKAHANSLNPLSNHQVSILKSAFADGSLPLSVTKIRMVIKEKFNIELTEKAVHRYHNQWGLSLISSHELADTIKSSNPVCRKRKLSHLLNDKQVKALQKAFNGKKPCPTNLELQSYIEEHFGVTFVDSIIQKHRRDSWHIDTEDRTAYKKRLDDQQVERLKQHFQEGSEVPKWQDIQCFILDEFGLLYTENMIRHNRKEWQIPTKEKQVQSRNISDAEITFLRSHFAQASPPPTNLEIQSFLSFHLSRNFSESTIRRNRKKWGISTLSKKDTPNEMSDSKAKCIKNHFNQLEIPPAWQELQAHLQNKYGIDYSQEAIINFAAYWNIPLLQVDETTCQLQREDFEVLTSLLSED